MDNNLNVLVEELMDLAREHPIDDAHVFIKDRIEKDVIRPLLPDRQAESLGALNAHSLAALRQIILTVIDERRFYFYEGEVLPDNAVVMEAGANNERLDFCDAVAKAIVERATPAITKGNQP